MKLTAVKPEYLIGGAVLLGALYLWARGPAGVAGDIGSGIVKGAGGLFGIPDTNATKCAKAKADGDIYAMSLYCPALSFADGAVGEVVGSVGDVLGVPRTNMTECQKAIAEGRTWDASFACPAKDFIYSLWN